MKEKGRMAVLALSAILLCGCAIQAGEISPNPALMAGTDPVPKESVAGRKMSAVVSDTKSEAGHFSPRDSVLGVAGGDD